MTWRTALNYNSHPGTPPARSLLMPVTVNRETLARIRTIVTDNTGPVSDTGWLAWGFVSVDVGLDWLLPGHASRAGSSWIKTECQIEVAAGIGRPWKFLWLDKITDNATSAVSYTSENEQLFLPGTSASIIYDAADGTTVDFFSGARLIPAEGL